MSKCARRLVVAAVVSWLAHPSAARAEPALALLASGAIATFDTATPQVLTVRAVLGLSSIERIVGIDLRPATGAVFCVSVPMGTVANALVHTFSLDPTTGKLTLVGTISGTVPGAADVATSIDFNPRVDRIRVVNVNDENFRINPNNGALAGDDPSLNPPTGAIIAEAYDRNVVSADLTQVTLYGISRVASALVTQGGVNGSLPGGANGGGIIVIGPLGVVLDPGSGGGFDISGATGTAYAALHTFGASRLFTIDLETGAATLVGTFPVDIVDLTILPAPPPPPPDTTSPQGLVDAPETVKRKVARAGFTIAFTCDEPCTASARVVAGPTTVMTGEGSAPAAGAVGTIALAPTDDGTKAFRRRPRTKATLTVSLTDAAGNTTPLTRPFLVRR